MEKTEVEVCTHENHGSYLLDRLNVLRHEGLLCDFSLHIGKHTFMVTVLFLLVLYLHAVFLEYRYFLKFDLVLVSLLSIFID